MLLTGRQLHPEQLGSGLLSKPSTDRFRYTIIRTKKYYTIKELRVQVHKDGTVCEAETSKFSPYHQSEIFETGETEPLRIITVYKQFLQYRSNRAKKNDTVSDNSRAGIAHWRMLYDETFLKGMAHELKKRLNGSYIYSAKNGTSFYVHWRQYNIRVSNHEHQKREGKNKDRWRHDACYGEQKHIGILFKLTRDGGARIMIGGGKFDVPNNKMTKEEIYQKVMEFLEHRGISSKI